MPIQRDFSITFDIERYIQLHGEDFARLLRQPARQAAFQQALDEAGELIQPAAIWERVAIRQFQHEKLVLANGAKIGGGAVVRVVGGAEELIVAVCTIGGRVEQRIRGLQVERNMFTSSRSRSSWGLGASRRA